MFFVCMFVVVVVVCHLAANAGGLSIGTLDLRLGQIVVIQKVV